MVLKSTVLPTARLVWASIWAAAGWQLNPHSVGQQSVSPEQSFEFLESP